MSAHQSPVRSSSTRCGIPAAIKENVADIEDIVLPPPSAVLAFDRPTCYSPEPPSPIEDYPEAPPINFRHRVPNAFWDNLPPLIAQASSPSIQESSPFPSSFGQASPTNPLASFITSRGTDTAASKASTAGTWAKHTSRASLFGNFFNANATSEPINTDLAPSPVRSEEYDYFDEEEEMNSYTRPSRLQRISTAKTSNTTSRFAWLTSKASALASSKSQITSPSTTASDPLLNLDVNSALFPHGPPDPFDPTSFNDLLANAESLILRLQTSYKAKCAALEDLRSEQSVQDEELDEAETRARHLRTQLEEMGRKREEAERMNEELTDTLVRERQWRMEEEERRKRSIRRARLSDEGDRGGVRGRRATGSISSDSGFESELDSEEYGSVFSRRTGMAGSEKEAQKSSLVRTSKEGSSTETISCRNCQGVLSGTSDLSSENHLLKMRVAELEDAVESCLDLMTRPWSLKS